MWGVISIFFMGKTLQRFFLKKIFFLGLLFGIAGEAVAQSAGDIAFVGINSNNSEFAIVALADLPSNTTIFFNDTHWNGNIFESGGIRWETEQNIITAGTIISFHNVESEEATVSVGTLRGSGINLSFPNTTLFSYVGEDIQTPDGFLAAISNEREQYEGTDLTRGEEIVLLNNTVMQASYEGVREGKSGREYLRLIGDAENNWRQSEELSEGFSMNITSFSFPERPGNAISDEPTFMTSFEGEEGWRGIASPIKNSSFKQLLGDFRIQGIRGSADPGAEATILFWEEGGGGSFTYPGNITDYMEAGRGYFIYMFEDNDPNTTEIQGGFPKTLSTDESLHDGVVDIEVSATDADGNGHIDGMEGFNLLGNPFNKELSVRAVKEELQAINTNLNNYIYVWNSELGEGNGGFELLDDTDVIAPTQPFWIRYLDEEVNGLVRLDRNGLTKDRGQESSLSLNEATGSLELKLSAEESFDTYRIELREEGEIGEDRLDGYKLFSLKSGSVNLYSTVGNGNKLTRNVLPDKLEEEIEIPLLFSATSSSDFSFNWEQSDDLPRDLDFILMDQKQNREINLRNRNSYSFELETEDRAIEQAAIPEEQSLLNIQEESVSEERFFLTIRPSNSEEENGSEDLPESVRLKPNYPNPFTNTTTIPYELDKTTEVTLTIWNMIGQKVATLIDGELKGAGPHNEDSDINWNAVNMPSGMYIARLEVGGEVFTRKMTLIK